MKLYIVVALATLVSVQSALAGVLDHAGVPHISGGVEAKPHSIQFQVALNVTYTWGNFVCGGALLSDRWVITAAHCVDEASQIIPVLGAHNITMSESTQKVIPVENVQYPPNWDSSLNRNDIALLKLKTSVTLDGNVKTIRLPKISQKNDTFSGRQVIAAGWGKVLSADANKSSVLRSVNSQVVSNWYCRFRYFAMSPIHDFHICVSEWWAKGTCMGDGGGPLVIEESDGEKTLIGVASFARGFPCQYLWPSVFTRVTSHLDWIHKTTGIAPRH